eukprot:2992890-Rhodomonas_salina.3
MAAMLRDFGQESCGTCGGEAESWKGEWGSGAGGGGRGGVRQGGREKLVAAMLRLMAGVLRRNDAIYGGNDAIYGGNAVRLKARLCGGAGGRRGVRQGEGAAAALPAREHLEGQRAQARYKSTQKAANLARKQANIS